MNILFCKQNYLRTTQLHQVHKMEHDYNQGEIYIATCTTTNKSYIGQAQKYVGENMQRWGTSGRWTRHVLDAFKKKSQFNYEIHIAIREHGKNSFEVKKLCDCLLENMDDLEQFYINKYNTLYPNGYNMTTGGREGGSHCEFANQKVSAKRKEAFRNKSIASTSGLQQQYVDNEDLSTFAIEENDNQGKGKGKANLGVRRTDKHRVREEDNDLPKYVSRIRRDDIVVGYAIKNFPIGVTKKQTVSKTFANKENPEKAFEDAKKMLSELENEYKRRLEEHRNEKQEHTRNSLQAKAMELPEYIYPNLRDGYILGYYVLGLTDHLQEPIPRRDFVSHANNINLEHAKKFIMLVNDFNTKGKVSANWLTEELPKFTKDESIPNHIRYQYYKGDPSGYRVDYFIRYDENNKQVVESKCFTSKKLTMEQKLQLAIDYVAKLDAKFKTTKQSDIANNNIDEQITAESSNNSS